MSTLLVFQRSKTTSVFKFILVGYNDAGAESTVQNLISFQSSRPESPVNQIVTFMSKSLQNFSFHFYLGLS